MAFIIENVGNRIRNRVVKGSPYRTGHLRYRGIKALRRQGQNTVVFSIGGQDAPHGTILNNVRVIKRNGKGYTNKHYNWIYKEVKKAAQAIATQYGGYIR